MSRPDSDQEPRRPAGAKSESVEKRAFPASEFGLIEHLARAIPMQGPGVTRSIGDDAAVLQPEPGRELVISTDTLNEGVHFLPDADPDALGYKSLAVNLSDLAAMGARPRWALMSLSLPCADQDWVDAFARGFARLAKRHGLVLVGGDTCSGPLSVTVVILGDVPSSEALRRDGGAAGDLIYVSGTLGDAALALRQRLAGQPANAPIDQALDRPEPQIELGLRLRGLANACIDLSDGLLADLEHLARASGLGAEILLDKLPASPCLASLPDKERWSLQLGGGDDYQLCFTVPEAAAPQLEEIASCLGIRLSPVGRLLTGERVRCLDADRNEQAPEVNAWAHFSSGHVS